MNHDVAIKIEHVSKKYCKSLQKAMFYGIRDICRNVLGISSHSGMLRKNEFWAVNDVSCEIKEGDVLGIIGPNGSGKTTLLKMLNGIFWPDKGKISIKGKVGALIEVGAGFHPLLTGRENIYINAAILGMTKAEVDKKFNDIVEFADIGDFLDTPVKNYSSGMFVRLGFAVAAYCEPDVLLIDEVLAVGDIAFQSKCYNRINELCRKGTTVVLVSHNIEAIAHYSTKVLYIDNGKMVFLGSPQEACEKYIMQQSRKIDSNSTTEPTILGYQISPSPNLKNLIFKIVDSAGIEKTEITVGEEANFHFSFFYSGEIDSLQIGVIIYKAGVYLAGIDSLIDGLKISVNNKQVDGYLKIPWLSLMPGKYTAILALTNCGDFLLRGCPVNFTVMAKKIYPGLIVLHHEWDIKNGEMQQKSKSLD